MKLHTRILTASAVTAALLGAPHLTPTAGALPLCGGNNDIKDAPVDCENSKQFTVAGFTRTIRIELHVAVDGSAYVDYFVLNAAGTAPQATPVDMPIRVVAHVGVSSAPGATTSDVTSVIPKGATTARITFTVVCGQIDIKAIFTANGAAAGRVAGPFVCTAPAVPTTAPPTIAPPSTTPSGPTTAPGTPGVTAPSSPGVPSSGAGASVRALPATGDDPWTPVLWAVLLISAGTIIVLGVRRLTAS